MDGIDLMPVVAGQVTRRDKDLFIGFRRLNTDVDGLSLIHGDYKILQRATKSKKKKISLFNLAQDPYEQNDLSQSQPERFQQLSKRLKAADAECQRSRDGADYRY